MCLLCLVLMNILVKSAVFCLCRIQSGSYLSTGWFTLILAMDMCKEIHVYGMINDTYCKYGLTHLSSLCIHDDTHAYVQTQEDDRGDAAAPGMAAHSLVMSPSLSWLNPSHKPL